MTTELKRCPFCGGFAEVFEQEFGDCHPKTYYQVGCSTQDCICQYGIDCNFDKLIEAVDAWNKRN